MWLSLTTECTDALCVASLGLLSADSLCVVYGVDTGIQAHNSHETVAYLFLNRNKDKQMQQGLAQHT